MNGIPDPVPATANPAVRYSDTRFVPVAVPGGWRIMDTWYDEVVGTTWERLADARYVCNSRNAMPTSYR